ncbi:MAG: methyltransferase domain-containing protein [Deltaproteobacteria bacterium]|nr:MAG: methyltransferase domain-containing protein [Deltaproteobacteria bacterium]
MTAPGKDFSRVPAPRLFKKKVPDDEPVTPDSAVLFRFGEQCNNDCPMCSNTGEASLFFHPTETLLGRAAFLHRSGFRRAVVTGGEPTIHPGFWAVVERLEADGFTWDINTHGRTFAKDGFARRAARHGLKRAIVSLHSHRPATSAALFGTREDAHHETVAGIDRLLDADVDVTLNCVLTRPNLGELEEYLRAGHARFGERAAFKFVFPSTVGKGGLWAGIATLRYDDVREPVQRLRSTALELGVRVFFESFPNCILEDSDAVNVGRWTFGETHYLDDAAGDRIYSMRHIEAELSAFGEVCRRCAALRRCPGVSRGYVRRYGVDELVPFPSRRARPAKTRANSFNFVRTATAVPWAADADACTAHARSGGLDPVRHLWLREDGRLTLHVTDTADFTAAEIARVKSEWSHLFVDRAPPGVLDDFKNGMRRVLPDPACGSCANRSRCGRRFRLVEGEPFAREEAWIARHIGGLRGRVLDVGCGEQLYREELATLLRSGAIAYTGLDPDEESLARLRAVLPEARLHAGDIERFEGEPASYDHVLCLRALNHVADVDEALSRMAMLLKPTGWLLLVECTPFAMLREAEQVVAADRAPRAGHQHFRNMASDDLLPFVRCHGLRVVEHHRASRETSNQWILLLARDGTVGESPALPLP